MSYIVAYLKNLNNKKSTEPLLTSVNRFSIYVSTELSTLTGLNSVLTKLSSTGGKEIRLIIR